MRLRGDQIEVFKILNGYEHIDRNMKDMRTRGRKSSFSQRTANEWNKLSTDCTTVICVNMFKNKLDTYLRRAGYT